VRRGGSTGIGLGLAHEFLNAGSAVIVCARSQKGLDEAKAKYPALITVKADVATAGGRENLAKWVITNYPKTNILINNAGTFREPNLVDETDNWAERQAEMDIHMSAPVHLAHLFSKHFVSQPEAAIINITSGLAYVPLPVYAVYSAAKAFLHSYTISSRVVFSKTNVRVVEISPPAVATSNNPGVPNDEFCAEVFKRFVAGEKEIGYKSSEERRIQTREQKLKTLELFATWPQLKFFTK